MLWQGRELAYRQLWEELGVSIPEHDSGTFSSLLYCPNPSHANSRSPAFQVNQIKPLCHCFGHCGISGTIEHAVQTILGCDEKAARRFIMRFTRVALGAAVSPPDGLRRRKSAQSLTELTHDLERFARGEFSFLPKLAREYLDGRGIDHAARGTWEIGFDEEQERLVIPARDERGNVRFLIRRAIGRQQPKYLYSPGSIKTEILFGLLHIPKTQRMLVLVEGSLDSLHLQGLGGIPAVGTLGSGLSDKQVRLIHGRDPQRIYTMFDRDQAGVQNVLDTIERLPRFPIFVCRYSKNSDHADPMELSLGEARRAIDRAIPKHEFMRIVRDLKKTPSKEVRVGT